MRNLLKNFAHNCLTYKKKKKHYIKMCFNSECTMWRKIIMRIVLAIWDQTTHFLKILLNCVSLSNTMQGNTTFKSSTTLSGSQKQKSPGELPALGEDELRWVEDENVWEDWTWDGESSVPPPSGTAPGHKSALGSGVRGLRRKLVLLLPLHTNK